MIKKYLLNSIVKFIENTVIIYMWKRNKKIDKRLCINIVESSSCISETNTALEINSISVEIKEITVKKKKRVLHDEVASNMQQHHDEQACWAFNIHKDSRSVNCQLENIVTTWK